MRPGLSLAVLADLVVLAALPAAAADVPMEAPLAPVLSGLGSHHHPISSRSPAAQRFFDQGMVLAFGFNHAEAERAFREAARLDPKCAICWWGAAWVLGPNYNVPMAPEAVPVAWEAIERARALSRYASRRERAYIDALAERYGSEVVEDRAPLERAFSDAMKEVSERYPDDLDAAIVFAESRMNLIPWDLWTPEGAARPEAAEAIAAVESVLARDPNHPQALHLWIHTMEKLYPERAEEVADRLRGTIPGAGHLVHMPGHIYLRLGRYHDAAQVNVDADAADEAYVAQCHAQGVYPLAYHSHNVHFIWASTQMEGRSAEAIAAARKLAHRHAEHHDLMVTPDLATLQYYYAVPFQALVRFGRWDEILGEPEPAADLPYTRAMWHFARGMAYTRKGWHVPAQAELAALAAYAEDPAMEETTIWGINSFAHVFRVAKEVLAGELAATRGDFETAVTRLEEAVFQDDALIYQEPHDWYYPARQSLGAVLLAAGRPADAEDAYREDLERNPGNGWSLRGLAQALEAQGKDASEVQAQFAQAWQYADIELAASRF